LSNEIELITLQVCQFIPQTCTLFTQHSLKLQQKLLFNFLLQIRIFLSNRYDLSIDRFLAWLTAAIIDWINNFGIHFILFVEKRINLGLDRARIFCLIYLILMKFIEKLFWFFLNTLDQCFKLRYSLICFSQTAAFSNRLFLVLLCILSFLVMSRWWLHLLNLAQVQHEVSSSLGFILRWIYREGLLMLVI
jgi:hypothetical protein